VSRVFCELGGILIPDLRLEPRRLEKDCAGGTAPFEPQGEQAAGFRSAGLRPAFLIFHSNAYTRSSGCAGEAAQAAKGEATVWTSRWADAPREDCAGESAQAVGDRAMYDLFLKAGNPWRACAGEAAQAVVRMPTFFLKVGSCAGDSAQEVGDTR
jgi:hypothetical protein